MGPEIPKRDKKVFSKRAQVHTTLPPNVVGEFKGYMHVSVPNILWNHSVEPPAGLLSVRFQWWGEKSRGTVLRVPVVREGQSSNLKDIQNYVITDARYAICSSLDKLKKYLNDMPPMVFYIGVGRVSSDTLSIAQVVIEDLGQLDPWKELKEKCSVVQQDGIVLGSMTYHCYLEVDQAVRKHEGTGQIKMKNVKFILPQKQPSIEEGMPRACAEGEMKSLEVTRKGEVKDAPEVEEVPFVDSQEGSPNGKHVHKSSLYEGLMEKTESLRKALTKSLLQSEDLIEEVDRSGRKVGVAATPTDPHSTIERVNDIHESVDTPPDPPYTNTAYVVQGDFLSQEKGTSILDLMTGCHLPHDMVPMEEGSEVGSEEDVTITSDCSDYPLHNTSILDKLLYSEPHPSSKGSSYDSEEVTLPAESVVSMMEEETKHLVQGVPTNAADHDSHTPQQDRHLSQHDDQNLQVSQPRKGLGVQGEAKEKRILRILGMDRLTWLGSVRSVRVEVSVLELDQHALMSHWQDVADTGIDQSVFFVEYHFPLTTKFTSSKEPIAQEVMRVASKRMKSGIVAFNHCSSFPISFTSSAILTWWGESLLFRIYARPPHHRMPLLFGKCSLELQRLLTSRVGREQFQLKIYPATLSDSVMPISHTPTGRPIGILQVEVQLVCKGKGRVLPDVNPLLNSSAESAPTEEHGTKTIVDTNPINGSESVCQFLAAPKHTDPSMTTLQLLLFLPDAVGVSLPSHNMEGVSPNCYIICRMFCTGRPPPVTDITWNSSDPSFNFKLSIPLVLSSSLLSNLQNGVLVVEVWHKTPGTTTNDMLIGLVKVSLSQFFLAYNDSSIWKSMVKLDYPVIGMDSYCPIVSPFTTSVHGHLGVLLALGTSTQVTSLLQHYAGGKYILQRPYSASGPSVTAHSPLHDTVTVRPPKPSRNEDTLGGDELDTTSHVLRITIRAVKNLSSLNSEIWGASDCFVQYHFPSQHMQSEGTSPAKAPCPYIPHRTPTIMCVADPIFNQEMVHAYTLPSSHSLEHVLLSACPSSSVPFQVWKRYYYPNIRDQLVAKGVLQLAKVCAVISMSRSSLAESKHTYTIPLTSTTSDSARAADGVLELSVSYSRASHTTTSEEVPVVPTSMVTLSIGVLRACGLKDVVAAALEREPSLLVQPAQVGVNSFVRLTLPFSCSKKQMQTKSIAQSFCPEYSHQFDLSLPLTPDHHRGGSFVQELLEGRQCVALFEVYHKVLKSPVKTAAGRDVTARHLRVPPEEVLLGSVELDLHQLLSRESGIRGWVPLCLSTSPDARGRKAGGLEVSIQFPSQHHRDLVVQEALQQGFSPPCAPWNKMAAAKLCLTIGQVGIGEECITYAASSIARKLCYLRYKVYDKNPVMTRVVKAATVHRGMASYELGHQSKAHVATSEELTWYLKEEELEVQVWLTASSNQSSVRPSSSDVLFGSCFVPLSGLLSDDPVVKGCYTLFKSGADTTGNGFVQLTVSLQEGSLSGVGKDLHITETDKESSTQPSTSTATSSLIPSAQPSTEGECVKKDSDLLNRIKEANLFDCCVVIHQAAIAQDCAIRGSLPAPYMTVHPHPLVDRITTPTAPPTLRPVWNHQVETKIPREFLDPTFVGLDFQVWSRPNQGAEQLVGTATVDLSPLSCGMPLLSGWYAAVDCSGHTTAHVNVTLNPHEKFKSHTLAVSPPSSRDVSQLVFGKTSSLLHSNLKESIDEMERVIGSFGTRLNSQPDIYPSHVHPWDQLSDHHPPPPLPSSQEVVGSGHRPVVVPYRWDGEEGGDTEKNSQSRGLSDQSKGVSFQDAAVSPIGNLLNSSSHHSASDTPDDTPASTPASTPGETPRVSLCEENGDEDKLPDISPPPRHHPHLALSLQHSIQGTVPKSGPVQSETEASEDVTPTSSDMSGEEDSEDDSTQQQTQPHTSRGAVTASQEGTHDVVSRLPNFFLPPHQLEENMRALRLSVLSKPPPSELLNPRHRVDRKKESTESSLLSTPEQLEKNLTERLRSYREARKENMPTFSEEETRRIARIFNQYQH